MMKLSKRYQVPIDGCEVCCQDEIVQMASKKQGTNASAGSPTDFVSASESVRVQQDFISGLNLSLIDFWARQRSSPGWQKQFSKPSELCLGFYFLSWLNKAFLFIDYKAVKFTNFYSDT